MVSIFAGVEATSRILPFPGLFGSDSHHCCQVPTVTPSSDWYGLWGEGLPSFVGVGELAFFLGLSRLF